MQYNAIDNFLLKAGVIDALFRSFTQNPLENILHRCIVRIILEIVQNNHQKLRDHLIFESKLLDVVVEKTKDDFFRPHVMEIANAFLEMAYVCKNYWTIFQISAHEDFFTKTLPELNKRNVINNWKKEAEETKKLVQATPAYNGVEVEQIPLNIVTEVSQRVFTCATCHNRTNDMSIQCPKCRNVTYCSRECQKKHWREGHSKNCM